MAVDLWTEKWRPTKINEYVFRDESQRKKVLNWLSDGVLPNLFLSGGPGTGKTSIARMLLNELDVNPLDIKFVNASNNNGIDEMRNSITRFADSMPVGNMRYVILDEADALTMSAQQAFRGIIEMYQHTCRFILTANYPHKIIPAIHSRCQGFHVEKLDLNEFTARIAHILINEGVEFELDTVDSFVQATYPDLRKCINSCQENVNDGKLQTPSGADSGDTSDWMVAAIDLFKAGQFTEGRKLICNKARPEEYEDVYRFMYRNLQLWGDSVEKQDQALLIIRDGLVKQSMCSDQELNLAAALVELTILAHS